VNERAERLSARLEAPLLLASVLTVPAIGIEESTLGGGWDTFAFVLDWVIWLAFLGEAVAMLAVVDDRRRWLREHPLDLAIVVLTPPFVPATLQAARVFRLLRVLRLLKLAVVARRMFSTEGVRDAAVLAMIAILAGGAAFAAVEKVDRHDHPIDAWDGVWWAITTVTTVGYGDQVPQTTGGRLIAIGLMLVGIGFVAILTAAAAQRFMHSGEKAEAQRMEVLERLDEIARRLERLERG
jgi:voltage-gated potassium channel